MGENQYWFVTAGYSFLEKFRVGVDYVSGKNKTRKGVVDSEVEASEIVYRASYDYSKKLNFQAWYSSIDRDSNKNDVNHFRFQAKYSF